MNGVLSVRSVSVIAYIEERKERAHVHETLLGLSVHGSQKVERHRELKEECVDEHKIAYCECPCNDIACGHEHHATEPGREDGALAKVEH